MAAGAAMLPTSGLFAPEEHGGQEALALPYVSAILRPWFNVSRSELYRESYAEGASEELAGQGLYGEYVLLFPESGFLNWTDGIAGNDFPLHRVEDILVRFDLLSVDDVSL